MAFDYKAFLHADPAGLLKKIKTKPKQVDPNKARDANRAKVLKGINASIAQHDAGDTNPKRGAFRTLDDHDGSAWAYFKIKLGNKIISIGNQLENAVPYEHLGATLKSIAEEVGKGLHDNAISDAAGPNKAIAKMRSTGGDEPVRKRASPNMTPEQRKARGQAAAASRARNKAAREAAGQ